MANNDPPKPPAAQPSMSDVLAIVQGLQASILAMGTAFGSQLKEGVALGIAAAQQAREAGDLNLADARQRRKALGPPCHKCRMPVNVCGGPEMKDEPVLDAKGEPVLKDGKPVTKRVEAKKSNEEDANHIKMVVLPNDPAAARWFQWIGINGVKFASRARGRAILVPRKNDFAGILSTFSKFEQEFKGSRKVKFNQGKRWEPKPLHFAGRDSPMGTRGPRYVS